MVENKWIIFISCCCVNFLAGMNFYSRFKGALDQIWGEKLLVFSNITYYVIYPLIYIISIPMFFKFMWKKLYMSFLMVWLVLFVSIWLKYFSIYSPFLMVLGHFLFVSQCGIIYCSPGTVGARYFIYKEKIKIISYSFLFLPLGISVGLILQNTLEKEVNTVYLVQGILVTVFTMFFVIFAEKDEDIPDEETIGFLNSWKVVMNDTQTRTMFFTISVNLSVVNIIAHQFFTICERANYTENFIIVLMVIFITIAFVGSSIFINFIKKYYQISLVLRTSMILSLISTIWWAFTIKGNLLCVISCLITGICLVGSLPLQLIALLDRHIDIIQPVSVNLVYFMSVFFIIGFQQLFLYFERKLNMTGLWLCAGLEFFSIASFIAEYDPKYIMVNLD